jgi:uncharacterized membrane-anchored protein YhcB (DUF1043 family)
MDATTISVGGGSSGYLGSIIQAAGTILAALIVGIAGGLITKRQNEARNRQDREAQYRTHAIELTKLEAEKKLKRFELENPTNRQALRPSILDFLANYRDLKELDSKSPGDLYQEIKAKRINESEPKSTSAALETPQEPPRTS